MDRLIAWVEIPSTDFDRAVEFYSGLLGVTLQKTVCDTEKMACLPGNVGCIFEASGYSPSEQGTIVSLNAGSQMDEWIKYVEKNGGKIVFPKAKIQADGFGYCALFIDTEGNRLGIYGD